MTTRDLIRLLGLLRAPIPWLHFDVGGYYAAPSGQIVQIDNLIAIWDWCSQAVELIACAWGWGSVTATPSPGEWFLGRSGRG
jgi:hypothetical protein